MSRNKLASLYFSLILFFGLQSQASDLFNGVSATSGDLSYVVCTASTELNVRDRSLSNILFQVKPSEKVIRVQSFGNNTLEKTIDGKVYSFIQVQFPEISEKIKIGWVAEELVRLKSQCPIAIQENNIAADGRFVFPTAKRPTQSYKTGMRAFKASRGGDRIHAAVDLYRNHSDPVLAVTTGTVIRGRYAFYQGTFAIEVKHSDGKVIRYGEITGQSAAGVSQGTSVSTGQTIGYVGTVNSGCCDPMLHFEMYSGKATGELSQNGNHFQRRSDLMDPTSFVAQWEKAQFGISF